MTDQLTPFLILIGALILWGAISPRSQWRVLAGWSFRNPEANEPSDAGYMMTRIVNVVMIIMLVILVVNDRADAEVEPRPEPTGVWKNAS